MCACALCVSCAALAAAEVGRQQQQQQQHHKQHIDMLNSEISRLQTELETREGEREKGMYVAEVS